MNAASAYEILTSTRRELRHGGTHSGPPPNSGGSSSSGSSTSSGGASSDTIATSSGIGLSGAYIYNALAAGNADAVETEADTLDVCLCHPAPGGQFHYHFWSSCL